MSGSKSPQSSEKNFARAFQNLKRAISTPIQEPRDLSGIIKDFEMTYELSWKVLKKKLKSDGHETLGARDVFSKAFQLGYIHHEKSWLMMIEDRNQTSHVYDENDAKLILERIQQNYLGLFDELLKLI
jgi:nucleotidyltransferase substrate binding protein (TIGR01987 family)